ncbi:hypothetical protein [Micromonospora sp. NPDC048830]|uniref:hypothetical protein n=1 Tax=Micromonospora sp. NPDC048830 TaxID=3364257 RepID=UPI00371BE483
MPMEDGWDDMPPELRPELIRQCGRVPLDRSVSDETAEARESPTAWLVVVLAAHHALTANPIRLTRLDHLDLTGRRYRSATRPDSSTTSLSPH